MSTVQNLFLFVPALIDCNALTDVWLGLAADITWIAWFNKPSDKIKCVTIDNCLPVDANEEELALDCTVDALHVLQAFHQ